MIEENLRLFAENNWKDYIKPLSIISSSDSNCLINSDIKLYCFDDVVGSLFPENKKPASVDGISFARNTINLFEFKTGFADRITRRNFDEEKARCPVSREICSDNWRLLRDMRDFSRRELRDSIILKAVESYITIEKKVLPECEKWHGTKSRMRLWIIIDAEPTDATEDILSELAKTAPASNNEIENTKKALKRLMVNAEDGNEYYYDSVEVCSASSFISKLETNPKSIIE